MEQVLQHRKSVRPPKENGRIVLAAVVIVLVFHYCSYPLQMPLFAHYWMGDSATKYIKMQTQLLCRGKYQVRLARVKHDI